MFPGSGHCRMIMQNESRHSDSGAKIACEKYERAGQQENLNYSTILSAMRASECHSCGSKRAQKRVWERHGSQRLQSRRLCRRRPNVTLSVGHGVATATPPVQLWGFDVGCGGIEGWRAWQQGRAGSI